MTLIIWKGTVVVLSKKRFHKNVVEKKCNKIKMKYFCGKFIF